MSIDLLHVLYLRDKICHAELEETNNNKKKIQYIYIILYSKSNWQQ
jgi:hypothetical protein